MFKSVDILICNYLFSENKANLDIASQAVKRLINMTNPACVFAVIDRLESDTSFKNDVVNLFQSAFKSPIKDATLIGFMDGDEQKDVLGQDLLEVLGSPRVDFQGRTNGPTVFWFTVMRGPAGGAMIISASYKTDIPTFYGEWFRNRLNAGFCRMVNPYNRKQHQVVSLQKEDVDGFIFWTKNLAPFLGVLDDVHDQEYPFVVQYTINGYPRALETRVVDAERSVESFLAASDKFGTNTLVWRYDTIIFSTLTDEDFHLQNFAQLAGKLAGSTDEVVVSFLQIYKKTKHNLDEASRVHGFDWYDPPAETKRELLTALVQVASEHKMSLSICTQPDLVVPGVNEARCVDGQRLMDIAGRPFKSKIKGTRTGVWLL